MTGNPYKAELNRRMALMGMGGLAAAAMSGAAVAGEAPALPSTNRMASSPTGAEPAGPKVLDLSNPADNMNAFLRMRVDLSGAEIGHWWTGNVWAALPGEKDQLLFVFEGFAFSRLVPHEKGYRMLHRELGYYRDPKTKEILEKWTNPFTGQEVEVLPVLNDPVNANFQPEGERGPFMVPVTELTGDVWFAFDAMLAYPSALPRADWPKASQSDLYEAAELFCFHCKREELDNPALTNVHNNVTWTRIGPWLPWMQMSDKPGQMVYHTRGKKIASAAELPEATRAYTAAKYEKYLTAPTEWQEPNDTSWTYYKRVMAERGITKETP
jgi:hypothetical protein